MDDQTRIDELESVQARLVKGLLYYADETMYDGSSLELLEDRGAVAREAINAASEVVSLPIQVARLEALVKELGGDLADVARIQRKELAKELSWDMINPDADLPPS